MDVAISKTQKRVIAILGISCADSYESAKNALESHLIRGDAIPDGMTWREVAKMSDADLLAALNACRLPSDAEIAEAADGDILR